MIESGRTPDEVAEIVASPEWRTFDPDLNEEFFRVLDEFGGEAIPDKSLRGGEGQIFLSDSNPSLGLKRWHASRLGDGPDGFDASLDAMEQARVAVHDNDGLAQVVEVTEIHARGEDWIIRDFDPDSKPLSKALAEGNPQAIEAQRLALAELADTADPSLQTIRKRISRVPPSANIHWSLDLGKILVIDMM